MLLFILILMILLFRLSYLLIVLRVSPNFEFLCKVQREEIQRANSKCQFINLSLQTKRSEVSVVRVPLSKLILVLLYRNKQRFLYTKDFSPCGHKDFKQLKDFFASVADYSQKRHGLTRFSFIYSMKL